MILKACWRDLDREWTHSSGPGGQHDWLVPPRPARCLPALVPTPTESGGWIAAEAMQGSYSPTGTRVYKTIRIHDHESWFAIFHQNFQHLLALWHKITFNLEYGVANFNDNNKHM